jgi:hypothetical protein
MSQGLFIYPAQHQFLHPGGLTITWKLDSQTFLLQLGQWKAIVDRSYLTKFFEPQYFFAFQLDIKSYENLTN